MPDSEHDPENLVVQVYVTADIPIATVASALSEDEPNAEFADGPDGDIADVCRFEALRGWTAQQICKHHRETAPVGGSVHSSYFLVFDDADIATKGCLVVNLQAGEGYADAVRHLAANAASSVASLCIGNTDWYEERQGGWEEEEEACLAARGPFALYDLVSGDEGVDEMVEVMEAGIAELDAGDENDQDEQQGGDSDDGDDGDDGDEDDDDESEDEDGEDDDDNSAPLYHLIRPETKTLAYVVSQHAILAKAASPQLSPEMFAVLDDRFESEGALILRVTPEGTKGIRCTGPARGELLRWIDLGFMTWSDAQELGVPASIDSS